MVTILATLLVLRKKPKCHSANTAGRDCEASFGTAPATSYVVNGSLPVTCCTVL